MERLKYFDGMKALGIFLVVYAHIMYISYGIQYHIASIHDVFINFYMPLFFFISGFFIYKENDTNTCHCLITKFKQLIIPPIIFGTLYAFFSHRGPSDMLLTQSKSGYWYTFVLFIFVLIYYTTRNICKNKRKFTYAFFFISISIYLLGIFTEKRYPNNLIVDLMSMHRWIYIIYFFIGIITKMCFKKIKILMTDNKFSTLLITVVFGFIFFENLFYKGPDFPFKGSLIQLSYTTSCILLVLSLFYNNRIFFEKDTLIAQAFNKIGQRTMDIYMLHFFFIPVSIGIVPEILSKINSIVIEFFVTGSLALLILAFSLITSKIIRLSNTLSKILFGCK